MFRRLIPTVQTAVLTFTGQHMIREPFDKFEPSPPIFLRILNQKNEQHDRKTSFNVCGRAQALQAAASRKA